MREPSRRAKPLASAVSVAVVLAATMTTACERGAAPLQRPPAEEQAEVLEAMVRAAMKKHDIAGMGAVIVSENRRLVNAAYGYADRERGTPATTQTRWVLGSITKLFTAVAVMQLVEAGQVDLDAPLARYLPELAAAPAYAAGPTVRQALTHHGGLAANYLGGWILRQPDSAGFRTLPRLVAASAPAAAPDTYFSYSNIGYGLLGAVVDAVSGAGYLGHVRGSILEPLGMGSTSFYASAADVGSTVMGYEDDVASPLYPIRDLPAGAMVSTTTDMERFLRFVLDRGREGVLGQDAFAEMLRRQNAHVRLDGDFAIGLGFWLIHPGFAGDDVWASHGGDLPPAFHTVLVTAPDRKTGVFLAANSSGSAEALIPLAIEIMRQLYDWQAGAPVTDPPRAAPKRLERTALDSLAGLYASGMGVVEVASRRGRLLARIPGIPRLQLVPRADGAFSAELSLLGLAALDLEQLAPLRVTFDEDERGARLLRLTALGMPLSGLAERYDPGTVHSAWRARTGRYRVVPRPGPGDYTNRNVLRDVSLADDPARGLLLSFRLFGTSLTYPLAARDADNAVILGRGGMAPLSGETIRARDDGGELVLEFSGLLLRRDDGRPRPAATPPGARRG